MKYAGVDTKTLLKKSERRLFFYFLGCWSLEAFGFVFHKYLDFYLVKIIAGFMFVLVIVFCGLFFIELGFPKDLKYIYGRDDVPDHLFGPNAWVDDFELIASVLIAALTSVAFIIDLFKQG